MKKRTLINLSLSLSLLAPSACSLSSFPSLEGLAGATAGAAVGAGIGSIIGDHAGKKTENTLMAGGIGALSGMAIGALVHDNRMELAKEDAQVIREAKQLDARQKEIDDTRRAVDSDSSWGKLEVKPWQERYNIENSEMPYQGPSLP